MPKKKASKKKASKKKAAKKRSAAKGKGGGSTSEKSRSACEMKICEDPETGELIVRPGKDCPPGYVEMAKEKMRTRGVIFEQYMDVDDEDESGEDVGEDE